MTEEWQKRDASDEEGAKRWGSICRKIDWTGVTFVTCLTRVDRHSARAVILDRRDRNERREMLEKNSNPFFLRS